MEQCSVLARWRDDLHVWSSDRQRELYHLIAHDGSPELIFEDHREFGEWHCSVFLLYRLHLLHLRPSRSTENATRYPTTHHRSRCKLVPSDLPTIHALSPEADIMLGELCIMPAVGSQYTKTSIPAFTYGSFEPSGADGTSKYVSVFYESCRHLWKAAMVNKVQKP